jgi:hypothetical protein
MIRFDRRLLMIGFIGAAASAVVATLAWQTWFASAPVPAQLEYLPPNTPVQLAQSQAATAPQMAAAGGEVRFDFSAETVGAPPRSFVPVVGNWVIGVDGDNRVLVVDGRRWQEGQPAAGIADRARTIYGERYAEFLDNVMAFAYYPYAVATGIDDFREGEISLRFKPIEGRIDQGMGILFDLQPNGDYLTVRANALENNLVLWKFEKGRRSSVKWVKDTPTLTHEWHDLRIVVRGTTIEGYLDGKLYLTDTLVRPVSGRIGVWSKADSVVYVDDFIARQTQ